MPFSTKRVDKATRWIESEIVDELERCDRRVFCIANPSDTFLLPGALRLEAKREDWLSEVNVLATESEVVVIYVSAISEGLLAELDLLRRQNFMNKSVVILRRKILRQDASPAEDFPAIVAPPLSILNQSAFGPIVGRWRFRRELRAGIEKAINA
jgi:hypothetical protein